MSSGDLPAIRLSDADPSPANTPIRVALDGHVIGRRMTGNETYIVNLAQAIGRRGDVSPTLYLEKDVVWTRPTPVRIKRFVSRRSFIRIPFELAVRPGLDRHDLLHVQYVSPPFSTIPVITAIHDVSFMDLPSSFPLRMRLRLRTLVKRSARKSRMVLTLSEFSRSRLIHHFDLDPNRIQVTPLAVDARWRRIERDAVAEVVGRFDLPADFVLTVGNLLPRKNVPRLVRAVAAARKAGAGDIHLVLAGQRAWRSTEVDAEIDTVGGRDWVHFLGYVSDEELVALYSIARVVAYLSHYEGFGLPVLEALACGAVVLASNAASIPEVAGDAAIQVDPTSDEAVTAGLISAWSDEELRRQYAARGPNQASRFSWDHCAELTVQAYRAALTS